MIGAENFATGQLIVGKKSVCTGGVKVNYVAIFPICGTVF